MANLSKIRQGREESVHDYLRRFRDTRNRCFQLSASEKELAGLALEGLRSYLKEKLAGTCFFSLAQLHQQALAVESRSKESQKVARHNINIMDYDSASSDDESKEIYAAQFSWSNKNKPFSCPSLKLINKNWHEEVKFTFNVAKCDKIFDELLKSGNITLSHMKVA